MEKLTGVFAIVALALTACEPAEVAGDDEGRDVSVSGVSTSCNKDTCPAGCCTPDGTCYSGTENARCGAAGAGCVACGAGQSCRSVGVGFFDPVNEGEVTGTHRGCATDDAVSECPEGCTGAFGKCHSGLYFNACGMGGSSCQSCSSGQACEEVVLGAGFLDRTCRTPTGPRWKVIVESATFDPPVIGGSYDALGGKPDAYVEISVAASGVTGRTQVVFDNPAPTFDAYVLTDSERSLLSGISIRIMDKDGLSLDDDIGSGSTILSRKDLDIGRAIVDFGSFSVVLWFVRE